MTYAVPVFGPRYLSDARVSSKVDYGRRAVSRPYQEHDRSSKSWHAAETAIGTKRTCREGPTTSTRDGTTDVPKQPGTFPSLTDGGRFGSLTRSRGDDDGSHGPRCSTEAALRRLQGGRQPPVRNECRSSSQPADPSLAISVFVAVRRRLCQVETIMHRGVCRPTQKNAGVTLRLHAGRSDRLHNV
jgi:hypothetical protein